MDVSRLRGVPGSKQGHHGKFFSSEENLNNNKNKLSYCHIEPIDVVQDEEMDNNRHQRAMDGSELVDYDDDGVRQITTKPLSPQSTSEDFKIYLANIQYLQNATNVLHVDDIRDLGTVFSDLGAYAAMEHALGGSVAMTRLSVDQEKHLNGQRRKLRKIHQEFWDLPTNHQEKPMVFGSQHKNRYKTILPNEHSRVILKPELGDVTRTEPYINANYIKVSWFFVCKEKSTAIEILYSVTFICDEKDTAMECKYNCKISFTNYNLLFRVPRMARTS